MDTVQHFLNIYNFHLSATEINAFECWRCINDIATETFKNSYKLSLMVVSTGLFW